MWRRLRSLAGCSQHAALGYFMLVASGGSSGSGDFQLLRFAPQDTACGGDAIRGARVRVGRGISRR